MVSATYNRQISIRLRKQIHTPFNKPIKWCRIYLTFLLRFCRWRCFPVFVDICSHTVNSSPHCSQLQLYFKDWMYFRSDGLLRLLVYKFNVSKHLCVSLTYEFDQLVCISSHPTQKHTRFIIFSKRVQLVYDQLNCFSLNVALNDTSGYNHRWNLRLWHCWI